MFIYDSETKKLNFNFLPITIMPDALYNINIKNNAFQYDNIEKIEQFRKSNQYIKKIIDFFNKHYYVNNVDYVNSSNDIFFNNSQISYDWYYLLGTNSQELYNKFENLYEKNELYNNKKNDVEFDLKPNLINFVNIFIVYFGMNIIDDNIKISKNIADTINNLQLIFNTFKKINKNLYGNGKFAINNVLSDDEKIYNIQIKSCKIDVLDIYIDLNIDHAEFVHSNKIKCDKNLFKYIEQLGLELTLFNKYSLLYCYYYEKYNDVKSINLIHKFTFIHKMINIENRTTNICSLFDHNNNLCNIFNDYINKIYNELYLNVIFNDTKKDNMKNIISYDYSKPDIFLSEFIYKNYKINNLINAFTYINNLPKKLIVKKQRTGPFIGGGNIILQKKYFKFLNILDDKFHIQIIKEIYHVINNFLATNNNTKNNIIDVLLLADGVDSINKNINIDIYLSEYNLSNNDIDYLLSLIINSINAIKYFYSKSIDEIKNLIKQKLDRYDLDIIRIIYDNFFIIKNPKNEFECSKYVQNISCSNHGRSNYIKCEDKYNFQMNKINKKNHIKYESYLQYDVVYNNIEINKYNNNIYYFDNDNLINLKCNEKLNLNIDAIKNKSMNGIDGFNGIYICDNNLKMININNDIKIIILKYLLILNTSQIKNVIINFIENNNYWFRINVSIIHNNDTIEVCNILIDDNLQFLYIKNIKNENNNKFYDDVIVSNDENNVIFMYENKNYVLKTLDNKIKLSNHNEIKTLISEFIVLNIYNNNSQYYNIFNNNIDDNYIMHDDIKISSSHYNIKKLEYELFIETLEPWLIDDFLKKIKMLFIQYNINNLSFVHNDSDVNLSLSSRIIKLINIYKTYTNNNDDIVDEYKQIIYNDDILSYRDDNFELIENYKKYDKLSLRFEKYMRFILLSIFLINIKINKKTQNNKIDELLNQCNVIITDKKKQTNIITYISLRNAINNFIDIIINKLTIKK